MTDNWILSTFILISSDFSATNCLLSIRKLRQLNCSPNLTLFPFQATLPNILKLVHWTSKTQREIRKCVPLPPSLIANTPGCPCACVLGSTHAHAHAHAYTHNLYYCHLVSLGFVFKMNASWSWAEARVCFYFMSQIKIKSWVWIIKVAGTSLDTSKPSKSSPEAQQNVI